MFPPYMNLTIVLVPATSSVSNHTILSIGMLTKYTHKHTHTHEFDQTTTKVRYSTYRKKDLSINGKQKPQFRIIKSSPRYITHIYTYVVPRKQKFHYTTYNRYTRRIIYIGTIQYIYLPTWCGVVGRPALYTTDTYTIYTYIHSHNWIGYYLRVFLVLQIYLLLWKCYSI